MSVPPLRLPVPPQHPRSTILPSGKRCEGPIEPSHRLIRSLRGTEGRDAARKLVEQELQTDRRHLDDVRAKLEKDFKQSIAKSKESSTHRSLRREALLYQRFDIERDQFSQYMAEMVKRQRYHPSRAVLDAEKEQCDLYEGGRFSDMERLRTFHRKLGTKEVREHKRNVQRMVDRHWDDFESAQAAQLKINNGHHLTDNELRCAKARKERTVLQKKEVILDENVRRQHVHALQIRCGEAPDIGVAKLNKAAHRYRQKIVQPDAYDLPSLSLEHHFEGSRR